MAVGRGRGVENEADVFFSRVGGVGGIGGGGTRDVWSLFFLLRLGCSSPGGGGGLAPLHRSRRNRGVGSDESQRQNEFL